jgi:tyrosyl-tRNA synthetase
MDLIDDLSARGLIHDSTDPEFLRSRLDERSVGVYVGFDPTADSLHAGHLLGQLGLRRFQMAGHRPFPLAGGATGMIGDPGGKSEERNLLSRDELAYNVSRIKLQLQRILDFEPGPYQATLVDNADWTAGTSLLDFLRDVGKHITVNQMMAKESVKARLSGDAGISYTEFSYMLLQANDFRHLHEHYDVEIQMGGSDQWGNITAGIDLIRKTTGAAAHGLTWPLLVRADGSKFGKTEGGAVWLDPERTSPYQFRQFWIQAPDDAISQYLLWFSTRPLESVQATIAEHEQAPERRIGQRALAHELTELVHGPEAARAADEAADVLFGGDPTGTSEAALAAVAREVPSSQVAIGELADVVELLVRVGLGSSKGDVRRTLEGGGYRSNGVVLTADTRLSEQKLLHGRYLLLQRGRKSHHLVEVFS